MPSLWRTINNSQLTINKRKGFTLIELLVVIAIIGILAGFAIASFTSAQAKGRDSRRKGDLDALKKALELAKQDCTGGGYYPAPITTGTEVTRYANISTGMIFWLTDSDLGYLKTPIIDPRNDGANYYYGYSPLVSTSASVCPNRIPANPPVAGSADFRLTARLENTYDPQITASQTKCPNSGFPADLVYAANTYVVCND